MQNARRQAPEELFGQDAFSPFHVDVVCRRCDHESKHEIRWALMHPEPEECEANGWDGVLLGRAVECPSCGVADDYALTPVAKLGLVARAIASGGVTSEPTGVRIGVAGLFDGTVVRRPTQALDHLRKYVSEDPESGEAWRRLGNACNRYGREAEAEEAWLRAVKADAQECEAAFSLIERCRSTGRPDDATSFLQLAIERFGGARNLDAVLRRRMADAIANYLEGLVHSNWPAALEAVWRDGALGNEPIVRMSAVDLSKITNWERLAAFLGSANLHALRLTADIPSEEYTQLESLLRDEMLLDYTPSQPFVRASPKVGRNDPCTCGSGKKFKRCCAESTVSARRVS